ncbi:DUF6973 domain-containing protein [Kitasatospora sp. NPDC127067]|uniref:DUF6973 domain-containing protein n=1 Tax=Kitasatospora sp. NPDC127067 TaxID=3347126 RepID=UPI00364F3A74
MNEAEKSFCKWPSRWIICAKAYDASELAIYHADKEGKDDGIWPGSNGNGGRRDAYRHCEWNGSMTLMMGAKTAKGFADRHEMGPKPANMSEETANAHHAMDYHSNATGRFFGQHMPDHMKDDPVVDYHAQIRTWCAIAVADGGLYSLSP